MSASICGIARCLEMTKKCKATADQSCELNDCEHRDAGTVLSHAAGSSIHTEVVSPLLGSTTNPTCSVGRKAADKGRIVFVILISFQGSFANMTSVKVFHLLKFISYSC